MINKSARYCSLLTPHTPFPYSAAMARCSRAMTADIMGGAVNSPIFALGAVGRETGVDGRVDCVRPSLAGDGM